MSEYEVPQVGDRVRVIVEGDVSNDYAPPSTDRFWLKSDDGRTSRIQATHVISVEKVAPALPTTPGSVVRHDVGVYFLTKNDGWIHQDGGHCLRNCSPGGPGCEVIFDAGAES